VTTTAARGSRRRRPLAATSRGVEYRVPGTLTRRCGRVVVLTIDRTVTRVVITVRRGTGGTRHARHGLVVEHIGRGALTLLHGATTQCDVHQITGTRLTCPLAGVPEQPSATYASVDTSGCGAGWAGLAPVGSCVEDLRRTAVAVVLRYCGVSGTRPTGVRAGGRCTLVTHTRLIVGRHLKAGLTGGALVLSGVPDLTGRARLGGARCARTRHVLVGERTAERCQVGSCTRVVVSISATRTAKTVVVFRVTVRAVRVTVSENAVRADGQCGEE